MKRTIPNIIKNGLCLGCGLCEAIHKPECTMRINSRGFYVPTFKSDTVYEQDRIIPRICPGVNIISDTSKNHTSIWGNVEIVSNAWAADDVIRQKSSSGGITSALAIYLLESKQVDAILHVGVKEDDYLHNRLFVSKTKEEVLRNNSSRYAPAAVFNGIKDILDDAPETTYAFVGKPCDIAGIQNFLRAFPQYTGRIRYFLSIFCAGMPSYNATERALATFKKHEKPISLRYRGDGWPGYFTAMYRNGTSCRMTYNDSWGKILGRDLGFRCKICPDGIGLLADISSGDSWNTKDGYPDFTEAKGKNFCFIRTKSGVELFESARRYGYIVTEQLDVNTVKDMQRYQYNRRHLVGWRVAAVQLITGGILHFKGLGYYKTALHSDFVKGAKDAVGTAKRLLKARKDGQ